MGFKCLKKCLIVIALISLHAQAGIRCDLAEKFGHPNIASNPNFWSEYNELKSLNKLTDAQLEALFKKYDGIESVQKTNEAVQKTKKVFEYSTTTRADKDIKKLPGNLRKHYEEFMSVMSEQGGFKSLYENPGKWHMEKLNGLENRYTVRLNGGYRVLFKKVQDGIEVLEVNRDRIHNL